MKYVAFDLETTGLDAEKDRVIEMCFIQLDDDLVEQGRWTKLLNPGIPIPAETVAIHNITDEMVVDAPPFKDHAARVQQLVDEAVLIGHNVQFDVSFIHKELVRAGQKGLAVSHPTIDTGKVERMVNSHRLGACYQRYMGNALDDAHRSEADTAATVDVLRKQREVHAERLPTELESLIGDKLTKHFDPSARSREWLDHGHRFYKDNQEVVRFGFGKHRDVAALEHTEYLLWMRDRDFPADTKEVVESLLGPEYKPTQRTL
jgi:DNA polymerase-3 subunit epsilon